VTGGINRLITSAGILTKSMGYFKSYFTHYPYRFSIYLWKTENIFSWMCTQECHRGRHLWGDGSVAKPTGSCSYGTTRRTRRRRGDRPETSRRPAVAGCTAAAASTTWTRTSKTSRKTGRTWPTCQHSTATWRSAASTRLKPTGRCGSGSAFMSGRPRGGRTAPAGGTCLRSICSTDWWCSVSSSFSKWTWKRNRYTTNSSNSLSWFKSTFPPHVLSPSYRHMYNIENFTLTIFYFTLLFLKLET